MAAVGCRWRTSAHLRAYPLASMSALCCCFGRTVDRGRRHSRSALALCSRQTHGAYQSILPARHQRLEACAKNLLPSVATAIELSCEWMLFVVAHYQPFGGKQKFSRRQNHSSTHIGCGCDSTSPRGILKFHLPLPFK
ncbi:hypothetical protein BDU57DRAFT_69142 [Ampelomyces quisqualis]|uniref:Uncharacterized protein n=1 Tax=Ampelomyces quisqualis TaxID=50730 RepID=A0A6A5R2Z4_AMPQU|nr:hypothetical protein BDU57DRAFT_69142 [Ampelomyces quisqualis]